MKVRSLWFLVLCPFFLVGQNASSEVKTIHEFKPTFGIRLGIGFL